MYHFWIKKNFQMSSLFETNKFHHGGHPFSGGPGAIAPVAPPLIRPWPEWTAIQMATFAMCFLNFFHWYSSISRVSGIWKTNLGHAI